MPDRPRPALDLATEAARSPRLFDRPHVSYVIFASPKSGTTWMQRLLSEHPAAVCTESRLFGDYFHPNPLSTPHLSVEKYVLFLSRYFAPAVEGVKTADAAFYQTLLFNIVDTLATTTLRTLNRTVYGEKLTPFHGTAMHAVELLQAYNPELRFVNLTRDGRDVITSGAAHWLNLRLHGAAEADRPRWMEAIERRTILDEDFTRFFDHWTEAVAAGLEARSRFPHYLHLSYEDLLADPVGRATTLFEFIGVDASPRVVQACVEATSFRRLSGGRERGDRHSFFRKGEAGDWASWFTREQTATFEERAGSMLTALGYPR
jgi:LPS sulfotransferase NodH